MASKQLGLGGGCHWCTEGVFSVIKGVSNVAQGWIAAKSPHDSFSEAILFDFDPTAIDLATLIEIHLHTHSSTADHSMRHKYRSAVYVFDRQQEKETRAILDALQPTFARPLVTQTLYFNAFKLNVEDQLNYYQKNPEKPFCKAYITPKLQLLMKEFRKNINPNMLGHLAKS